MGSFRQLLLVAFMLIAALLGGTALHAVVILDRLMAQSSEEAARALELNGAAQSLAGRTAAWNGPRASRWCSTTWSCASASRKRSRAARDDAAADDGQGAGAGRTPLLWQQRTDAIAELLDGPGATALERERMVAGDSANWTPSTAASPGRSRP